MNVSTVRTWLAALALSALAWPAVVGAQTGSYPTKPIRVVLPLAAGGTTDLVARIMAQHLTEALGQPVIVDNRTGAGTTIGSAMVARAVPDGYTLLVNSDSLATTVPLYPKLPYNPVKDLAPIGSLGLSFFVLAVPPTTPVKSVKEFITLAQSKQLSYASAGAGTISHLAVELFMANTTVKMLHVPFKGGVPSLAALLGGQVDAIFNPIANILPIIRSGGKVRPLAVTSSQRTSELLDVPTLAESGLPQCTVITWLGFYAPAGTLRAIIDRLNAETNKIVQRPEVQERFVAAGLTAKGSTPAELGDNLKFEIARWTKLINNAGIKIN